MHFRTLVHQEKTFQNQYWLQTTALTTLCDEQHSNQVLSLSF
jgi:hypothetical protein